jgi:mono/diheme cytochrome c family protein
LLNGTIESLPPGSGDPPPDDGDGNNETNDRRAFLPQLDLSRTPNTARGEEIYTTVRTACHGPMGEGGHLGVPFNKELAVVDIVVTARSGVDGTSMPAFGGRSASRSCTMLRATSVGRFCRCAPAMARHAAL